MNRHFPAAEIAAFRVAKKQGEDASNWLLFKTFRPNNEHDLLKNANEYKLFQSEMPNLWLQTAAVAGQQQQQQFHGSVNKEDDPAAHEPTSPSAGKEAVMKCFQVNNTRECCLTLIIMYTVH